MDSGYCVSRKGKLLKEFDETLERIRGLFVTRYGEDSEAILQEARRKYEALIPQLPYVGGRQPFTRFLRRFLGFMTFSPSYLRRVKKGAQKSHERQYPGNYVYDYVARDGATFDYGVDYVECGPLKFLTEQKAPELAPISARPTSSAVNSSAGA
jgi:hypothetical protein